MPIIRLASETDFAGWRTAGRTLRARRVRPDDVIWTVDASAVLFDDGALEPPADCDAFTVPREFLKLAEAAILHRSDERFALLYRMLWRLGGEPMLLWVADADTDKARDFAQGVGKAAHAMKAFVRFQSVSAGAGEALVAWFEPAHRVTEVVAPFFARRHAERPFSLLTPDACAHWDTHALSFTPGADPADAPPAQGLEDYWRARYAGLFAARCGNLPEAAVIAAPVPPAEPCAQAMATANTTPAKPAAAQSSRRVLKAAMRVSRDAPYEGVALTSLGEVAAGIQFCRRCDLHRDSIQGVAGEGPEGARLMLVGEQPGDQEDLAGQPFVGPAGQMLDRALEQAGVPRAEIYVTNAVKHFKFELRGKKRLHKTPAVGEVTACRWWLDNERRIVRPRVVVALGATAALSVFGRPTPISKSRGRALQLPDQAQGVVTYHPSFLLRVPDADAKAKAFGEFVQDLKFAWGLAA
jgi:DNA polymerase